MRYFALATDYDSTLARDGSVDDETLAALQQLQASGRRLILVTGREVPDLLTVFEKLPLFDAVVAENGGVLYNPTTKATTLLCEPVPSAFASALKRKGVDTLYQGEVIVATREPHETTVLEVIRDMGLELQVIFNKGAVMVLPTGVNKATGLRQALRQLSLSPHNVVGVGDAENDHGFLDLCEFSAAVRNALPTVKQRASRVLTRNRGEGVQDLISAIVKDDLQSWSAKDGPKLVMGETRRGSEVEVPVHGVNLMFTGSSGGGKSTLAKAFLERLHEQRYQFCVIDPEGDYEEFEVGIVLGDRTRAPLAEEVLQVLADPDQNVVVNMLGVPLEERPKYFNSLLADIQELRARTGRPHWLLIDEAHHVLPAHSQQSGLTLPQYFTNTVMITVEPAEVLPAALEAVTTVFTVGKDPEGTLRAFARATRSTAPAAPKGQTEQGEALVWQRGRKNAQRFRIAPSSFEHRRHRRKYATGDVGPERSFYFRGPEDRLELQARNLIEFLQIGKGLDDDTWNFHLRRGDYSTWFRDVIKDPELAERTGPVEGNHRLSSDESWQRIQIAISERYTLPEESPSGLQDEEADKDG